ncbi:antirestriction protein [Salmonella enterica subsp. enterica serovar Ball]|nr:antirestriction protein [Salmonella enterica subsp. enterica serovar Minnesota]ECI4647490.1 antirestriction protein [Salmonella enterica subsp. salamae]EDV5023490.1 antirestriction protein [Salmonella enterica subsp. enterica serovar Ball]
MSPAPLLWRPRPCATWPGGFPLSQSGAVCGLARKMITGYEGGFWHFIRLPDGGGYMMPDCDRVHMINSENWFDRTVSADAVGIILTSLAINRRCWTHHDCGNVALTHLYMLRDTRLWNHITFHPECNAIYAALD